MAIRLPTLAHIYRFAVAVGSALRPDYSRAARGAAEFLTVPTQHRRRAVREAARQLQCRSRGFGLRSCDALARAHCVGLRRLDSVKIGLHFARDLRFHDSPPFLAAMLTPASLHC